MQFRCYNLKAVTTDTFKTAKVEKVRENEKILLKKSWQSKDSMITYKSRAEGTKRESYERSDMDFEKWTV